MTEEVKIKRKISLSGIKPTGTPHLGNYLGMIKPALELVKDYDCLYFIADYHALTTVKDKARMQKLTLEIAATWLALGLDPQKVTFFQQSRVPEIFELSWILSCFCAKGMMNRAHAYKALTDENKEAGREQDEGVNMGLYNYPVLMSADILLFGTDVVPVGQDQKQHVEYCRDLAQSVNSSCGNVLTVPQPLIHNNAAVIPGLDGRKMSKSYGNVLPIFEEANILKKAVMRIVTDSSKPEDPKDPEKCNVFNIYRHFASEAQVAVRKKQYLEGGVGYGDMKKELFEILEACFGPVRSKYQELLKDKAGLVKVLEEGSEKARVLGARRLDKIRMKLGLR